VITEEGGKVRKEMEGREGGIKKVTEKSWRCLRHNTIGRMEEKGELDWENSSHISIVVASSLYGWTLRDSNDEEIDCGSGSLGRYYTAFDGAVAAIEEGVKAIRRCNRICNHVSIHADSTAAIARVQHNKCGAGQSRAVKVIGHIQRLRRRGQTASIGWIKGHSDNKGNDRADYLAGQATESQGPSGQHQESIAWMREKISNSYTTVANIELQSRGKLTIMPPPPKKSALDKARNREARIASQLRTNHWLSGVYLK
jgi:ribonuclease HI